MLAVLKVPDFTHESNQKTTDNFYTGIIVLTAMALAAIIAFGQLAAHDATGGIVLIAGFAVMSIVALMRVNEKHWPSAVVDESDPESVDADGSTAIRGKLGREGFGGPGNPDPLLRSIFILQAAIIVVSALTVFDAQAWVFVFYFMGIDFTLYVIMKRLNGIAAETADGEPVSD